MKNVCFLMVAVVLGACSGEASVQEDNSNGGFCETVAVCNQCPAGAEASCEFGQCYCTIIQVVETEGCITDSDCAVNCGNNADVYEPVCQTNGACFCRELQRECYTLKRGEFAFRIMRELVDLTDYPTPATPTFADVPSTHKYYVAIEAVVDYGIMDGFPEQGGFRPESNLNRAEGSKIACVALDLLDGIEPPQTPTYSDVEPYAWFYAYVEGLTTLGLTRGYADKDGLPIGRFGPADDASSCFMNEVMIEADFIAF